MDHGRVLALGHPQQLIALGGRRKHIVEFAISGHESGDGAADAALFERDSGRPLAPLGRGLAQLSVRELHIAVPHPRMPSSNARGCISASFAPTRRRWRRVYAADGRNLRDNKLQRSSLYQLSIMRFRLTCASGGIFLVSSFPFCWRGTGDCLPQSSSGRVTGRRHQTATDACPGCGQGADGNDHDEPAGSRALASGSILPACHPAAGRRAYRYDDTNPTRERRACWLIARFRRRQDCATASPPRTSISMSRAARYIDFVVPGFAGNEPDGFGDLGDGIFHRRGETEEAGSNAWWLRPCRAGSIWRRT